MNFIDWLQTEAILGTDEEETAAEEAWDYQQKKIDELGTSIDMIVSINKTLLDLIQEGVLS